MSLGALVTVAALFFVTSSLSVVTGSTSLITVPLLITFGVESHVAVATNMFALAFMSAGGTLPFVQKGIIERRILPLAVILTVIGSAIGAFLLLRIPTKPFQLTIAAAIIAVAVFSLTQRDQDSVHQPVSSASRAGGYVLTLALAVYGGLFSGGYVTILTAVFVFLFGLSFLEAVATTKVINLASSLVATAIFAVRGLVDYKLGLVLGGWMFIGAIVGGHLALRLPAVWLRRVFVIVVISLGVKLLLQTVVSYSNITMPALPECARNASRPETDTWRR